MFAGIFRALPQLRNSSSSAVIGSECSCITRNKFDMVDNFAALPTPKMYRYPSLWASVALFKVHVGKMGEDECSRQVEKAGPLSLVRKREALR